MTSCDTKLALAHGAMIEAIARLADINDRISAVSSSLDAAIEGDLSAATLARPAILEAMVRASLATMAPPQRERVVEAVASVIGAKADRDRIARIFDRVEAERRAR